MTRSENEAHEYVMIQCVTKSRLAESVLPFRSVSLSKNFDQNSQEDRPPSAGRSRQNLAVHNEPVPTGCRGSSAKKSPSLVRGLFGRYIIYIYIIRYGVNVLCGRECGQHVRT